MHGHLFGNTTVDTPLVGLLLDRFSTVWGAVTSLLARVASWLPFVGPFVLLVAVGLGWGFSWPRRVCRQSWHQGAQVVTVQCPPSVPTCGVEGLWRYVAAVLRRPWWKRLLFGTPAVAWEYVFTSAGIAIRVWVPGLVPALTVQRAIEATWPGARTRVQDTTPPLPEAVERRQVLSRGGTLRLARPESLPIQGEIDRWDPLRWMLTVPSGLTGSDGACVQILVRPATGLRLSRAQATSTSGTGRGPAVGSLLTRWLVIVVRALLDLITPGLNSSTNPPSGHGTPAAGRVRDPQLRREATQRTEARVAKRHGPQCETLVRYAVTTTVPAEADREQYRAAQAQLRDRVGTLASSLSNYEDHNYYRSRRLSRPLTALARRELRRGDLLSVGELAALAHLPEHTAAAGLAQAGAKALSPPAGVARPGAHVKPLGTTNTGDPAPVGLRVADARHHLHVLGATGVGKSTLLGQMLLEDIHRHRGVVVIDPKGDLVTDLLARLPKTAADRLVVFDPDQPGAVPCLNPLQTGERDVAVDQLVSVFHRVFASSWGPRTEDVFRSACLTLRARSGGVSTLADIPRLLDEAPFRQRITAEVTDPVLQSFWAWYEALSESARASVIAPLMNKLRAVLLRPFVRDALAGGPCTVDMGHVLDGGICLARLPKGGLGDETTQLFGSLLVASAWQAATARSRIPHAQRRDASMVLDECQNFLTLPYSLEDMLAEARGYRFSLTLAHQHLGQLDRDLREGIATNARNKVWFTAGPDDARALSRHTTPNLDEHDLAHLPAYTAAARLVIRGAETQPFTLTTRPFEPAVAGRAGYLRSHAAQALPAHPRTPTSTSPESRNDSSSVDEPSGTEPSSAPDETSGLSTDSASDPGSPPFIDDKPVSEPDEILLDPDPSASDESRLSLRRAESRPPERTPTPDTDAAGFDPRR